jgi:hypothetical protein
MRQRLIVGVVTAALLAGIAHPASAETNSRMCEVAYQWYEQGGWWGYYWGYVWAFSGC